MFSFVYLFILGITFVLSSSTSEEMNAVRREEETFTRCDNYESFNPLQNDKTDECKLNVSEKDMDAIVWKLHSQDFQISLLKINMHFSYDVNYTECTILPLEWVWTYAGKKGGEPYLHLMKEYSVYSIGLLDTYSLTMDLRIDVLGPCRTIIGERNTTGRIAIAFFKALKDTLNSTHNNYIRHMFLCYLSRFRIKHMYNFYKYFISNLQSLGYRCCTSTIDTRQKTDIITCSSKTLLIDGDLWWNFPFYMGFLLFLFLPMFVLKVFASNDISQDCFDDAGEWLASSPISVRKMLQNIFNKVFMADVPMVYFCKSCGVLISFSVLALEICLYRSFLYDFLVSSVNAFSLFDWKSMAAGYILSRHTFLECFGGPYIALILYITTFSILLCIPRDISVFIERGLKDDKGLFTSLLTIDITTRGKFGAILNIQQMKGYTKLYTVLKANIYMVINPAFWRFGLILQKRRFQGYMMVVVGQNMFLKVCFLLFIAPIYIFICITEWLFAIIINGIPMLGLVIFLIRAYRQTLQITFPSTKSIQRAFLFAPVLFVTIILLYDLYILSLIIIGSFVFICRVCTYTFTGLIAYPNVTYGYVVFTITVIIYISESIQNIGYVYSRLFDDLKRTCQGRMLGPSTSLIKLTRKEGHFVYVSKDVFRYTVKFYRPLRIELLFSFLRICLIVIILYMCISNLLAFNNVTRMPALTQAVTALFICLIPKLWHMFASKNKLLHDEAKFRELQYVVDNYCRSRLYHHHHHHPKKLQSHNPLNEEDDVRNDGDEHSGDDDLLDELLYDIEIEQ